MPAGSSRGRLVAVAYVALLTLSAVPAFVPTASAAAPNVLISDVIIAKGGVEATSGSPWIGIGETMQVRLYANVTIGATDCDNSNQLFDGSTPSFVATADLTNFTPTLGAEVAMTVTFVFDGTPPSGDTNGFYSVIAWGNFSVGAGTTEGARALTATLKASCTDHLAGQAAQNFVVTGQQSKASTGTVFLDNVRPTATSILQAVTETGGAGSKRVGVGGRIGISLSGVSTDVRSVTAALDDVNPAESFTTTDLATAIANLGDITIIERGVNTPALTLTLTDLRNNTGTIDIDEAGVLVDAHRPSQPGTLVATRLSGPAFSFGYTPAVGPQADDDVHNLTINVTPVTDDGVATGATTTIECRKDAATGCVQTSDRPFLTYEVRRDAGGFAWATNQSYNVSITPRDDVGTYGPAKNTTVRTLSAPVGIARVNLVSGLGGAGTNGGTGTTYSITLEGLTDVWGAVADVSKVSTAANTSWEPADRTKPITRVVDVVGQDPADISVLLRGYDGTTAPATVYYGPGTSTVSFFDTIAPGAISAPQAIPESGGNVRLRFTAPADADVASYWVRFERIQGASPGPAQFAGPFAAGSESAGFVIPGSRFDMLDVNWAFRVVAQDAKGNNGTAFPVDNSLVAKPSVTPLSISFTTTYTAERTWPTLGGSWVKTSAGAPDGTTLGVTVKNVTSGQFWLGTDPTQPGAFGAETLLPALVSGTGSSGSWSFSDADAALLPNGSYLITAKLTDTTPDPDVVASQSFTMTFDWRAPTVGAFNIFLSPPANVAQNATMVTIAYNVTDRIDATTPVSGIKTIEYTFVKADADANKRAVITGIDGLPVKLTCPSAACALNTSGAPTAGLATWNGTLVARLPNLPVGDYHLNATVTDVVGGESKFAVSNVALHVVPRIFIDETVLPPQLVGNVIFLNVSAGWDNSSSRDPLSTCRAAGQPYDRMCRLTDVRIEGRNGDSAGGTAMGTVTTPALAPRTVNVAGNDVWVWNYSPTGSNVTLPATLDPTKPLSVRAVARIPAPTGATAYVEYASDWIPVRTPGNVTISIARPESDWRINTTGPVWFLTNYTILSPPATPYLEYTAEKLAPTYQVLPTERVYAFGSDPRFKYNFSWNLTTFGEGEYRVNMSILTNASAVPLANATRYFARQETAPVVTIDPSTSQVFNRRENWVPAPFAVTAIIDHGAANLTTLNYTLTRNVKDPADKTLLNNTEGGFVVTEVNRSEGTPGRTWLNLTVQLPESTSQGDAGTVRIVANTDAGAWTPAAPGVASGSLILGFRVDAQDPAGAVRVVESVETGNTTTPTLKIHGFAQETGSGVNLSAIEVRLYDVTNDLTFDFSDVNTSRFVAGLQDLWGTSALKQVSATAWRRDVNVDLVTDTRTDLVQDVFWSIARTRASLDANGQPTGAFLSDVAFNQSAEYRVDVRVRDNASRVSEINTTLLRLDPQRPTIAYPATGTPLRQADGSAAPASIGWHPANTLAVNVTDNNCVKRVSLRGVHIESNTTLGPYDMTRKTALVCNDAGAQASWVRDAGVNAEWQISLKDLAGLTDRVGNLSLWIEVEDRAGNVNATPTTDRTYRVQVFDSQRAIVEFVRLEPPRSQAGTYSRVVADVFENFALDRVEVYFEQIFSDGRVCDAALKSTLQARGETCLRYEGVARPVGTPAANGTGVYEARTDTDFNITDLAVGDYLWTVRAVDVSRNVTCTAGCHQLPIRLNVTAEGAPFIAMDEPANGTSVLNATPSFTWRVLDKTVTAQGIRVEAGAVNGTLALVNATITALPRVGNTSVGYIVNYAPPALNVSNYSIRVTATSSFITTNTWDFDVDAIAPDVTVNLTGGLPLGGKTWAVSGTRATINATDNESTLASITYRVNGGAPVAYTVPVQPTGEDGEWTIEALARDAAGNVGRATASIMVDRSGPALTVAQHGDKVTVTVNDAGVGVDEGNVSVHFAYGEATAFTTLKLAKVAGNSYRAELPGNATETGLRYWFDAKDLLGNTGTRYSAAQPHEIAKNQSVNNPPKITLTAPPANTRTRGTVDLQWLASDPDGDDVSITIALRDPAGSGSFLLTGGENTGAFRVNVSGRPAGAYTVVVTASDGEASDQATVVFVLERGQTLECVTCPPSTVQTSRPVTFGIAITPTDKNVTSASYVVKRDGQNVTSGQLSRQQNVWAGSIVPTEPGNYKVYVTATYSDGTSETEREVSSFVVQGAPTLPPSPTTFPTSLILLLVVGVLTIALAAYGAFVRWR